MLEATSTPLWAASFLSVRYTTLQGTAPKPTEPSDKPHSTNQQAESSWSNLPLLFSPSTSLFCYAGMCSGPCLRFCLSVGSQTQATV